MDLNSMSEVIFLLVPFLKVDKRLLLRSVDVDDFRWIPTQKGHN